MLLAKIAENGTVDAYIWKQSKEAAQLKTPLSHPPLTMPEGYYDEPYAVMLSLSAIEHSARLGSFWD